MILNEGTKRHFSLTFFHLRVPAVLESNFVWNCLALVWISSFSLTGCCMRFSHVHQNSTSAWQQTASSGPKFHTSSPSAVYPATTHWTSWTRNMSWCRPRGHSGMMVNALTAAWTTSAARRTNEMFLAWNRQTPLPRLREDGVVDWDVVRWLSRHWSFADGADMLQIMMSFPAIRTICASRTHLEPTWRGARDRASCFLVEYFRNMFFKYLLNVLIAEQSLSVWFYIYFLSCCKHSKRHPDVRKWILVSESLQDVSLSKHHCRNVIFAS